MSDTENVTVNDAAQPAAIPPTEPAAQTGKAGVAFDLNRLGLLQDVMIPITIEVGRTQMKVRDLLALDKGSMIELNKAAGEPVDIYVNGKLISVGNIVTANGKYCVRLIAIPDNHQPWSSTDASK